MHSFDCPFQFAAAPEFSLQSDHAESAAVVELDLRPGDIIVAGTDGLWDNIEEDELLTMLPGTPECIPEVGQRTQQGPAGPPAKFKAATGCLLQSILGRQCSRHNKHAVVP